MSPELIFDSPRHPLVVDPHRNRGCIVKLTRMVLFLTVITVVTSAASDLGSAASPVGKWRGSWTSKSTGHRGPLRAHVRRVDADTYRAVFVGRFFLVVPFAYPARLDRVPGTHDRFSSRQTLPLIGTYQMNASVSPHRFHATFHSGNDQGTFDMSR